MNKHAEAVKKGGDFWWIYLSEQLSKAHTRSRIQSDVERKDDFRMHMCQVYGRNWQDYTPGAF